MTRIPSLPIVALAALGLASAAGADPSSEGAQAAERTSVVIQMSRADRDRGASAEPLHLDYPALVTDGSRQPDPKARTQSETGAATASAPDVSFWFYDADVVLFNDRDGDGYFHGIDLLFDADTIYSYAEVYAVAYLSLEGGPWNEYAVTDAFSISGTDVEDEYVIVTELVSGYPTGSYDLLIELFDAVDGSFLASYGPEDSSALSYLALEDAGRDPFPRTTTVIVREGGGGSLGWPALLILLLAAWRGAPIRLPAP